ncbi:MAG: recombinase [Candidatus Marinimicrobia bacterium]|nr:recombinase [Candidatus Neomarinimicrobiota bacterium]
MSIDYEEYEKDCEKIRKANEKLLSKFEDWLVKGKLGLKTINKHVGNIDFYINEYLLYDDTREPEEGVSFINMFLGYWFIRKAMWASESSIKGNASSLKKFYTFMQEIGRIDKKELEYLKITINDNMSEWINTLKRYDDPAITDMEEVWGFK